MKINYAVIWAPFCNLFNVQYTQHTIRINLVVNCRSINYIKQLTNLYKPKEIHFISNLQSTFIASDSIRRFRSKPFKMSLRTMKHLK